MSLQLIYGRTGSGKSELINKSLLQTKGLLIVPETYTFISEKQVAKLCGALGFSDIEVLSFLRLFHKLSDRGPLGEPSVDPAGKIMALSMITEQLHDELTLLKHSCEKAGFAESMLSFISELKRYSVSPESLLEASKNVASPLLSSKLSDISKIYSAYTAFLETGYTDRDDDLDRLYSLLLSKRPLEGKYIYIDRFVNFTVAEYKIIDAMLNQCEKVTVALPCEVGSLEMQFFTSQRAAERLTELAVTSGVEVNTPIMRRPISQGEKAHLEQNFFAFEPDKWAEETKNISVFIAKNRYTEIENAAREICRLVREEGYRYYDISVISRDWQNYDMQIKSVFRKFKIPYTDTSKESAGSHPVSLFILAALESVISGFTYEPVFKYLKCGFADITEEDIDRLENYVLATGIKGDAFIKEEKWNYRSSLFFGRDITSKELEELNALDISRRIVIAPLLKLKEGIKGKRTAKEFCTALYAFIKDTQLDEKIQHRSEQLLLEGKSDLAAKDVSVYNCIISSMDSLISCCQDLKRGPKKYAEALSEGLNSIKSAIIPSAVDCVNTGNAPRTKGSDSKVVFLVGVNDGIFPAVSSSGGILTDSDRRMLHDASIELAPDSQGFNFEEQALVYSTLTLAKDKLYVSYSLADTDGTTLRPSVIIRMLKEIFPDIKTLSDVVPRKAYELISAPEGTFDHMICALRRIYDGQLEDSDWLKVYGWFTENKNDEFQAENAVKAFNRKNFAKSLSEDTVKEFFNQNMKTSVSRLETYKSCPFRYYMNYMIMAKPRKVALVSPADAGSLLHYYIESFSSKLKLSCMSWNDVTEEYINQEAASITDEVISKSQSLMLKDSKRASYQIVRLQRLASKSLALIRRHIVQGSFEPLGYEISFEDGGDFLPLEIPIADGSIKLTGRIDRADMLKTEKGEFIRVIDYKSGNKTFNLSEVYHGLNLQLSVYLLAICRERGASPAGILYFKIDDPLLDSSPEDSSEDINEKRIKALKMTGMLLNDDTVINAMDNESDSSSKLFPVKMSRGKQNGDFATLEQFNVLFGHIKSCVNNIIYSMKQGDISIDPVSINSSYSPCSYCDYKDACLSMGECRALPVVPDDIVWDVFGGSGDFQPLTDSQNRNGKADSSGKGETQE